MVTLLFQKKWLKIIAMAQLDVLTRKYKARIRSKNKRSSKRSRSCRSIRSSSTTLLYINQRGCVAVLLCWCTRVFVRIVMRRYTFWFCTTDHSCFNKLLMKNWKCLYPVMYCNLILSSFMTIVLWWRHAKVGLCISFACSGYDKIYLPFLQS